MNYFLSFCIVFCCFCVFIEANSFRNNNEVRQKKAKLVKKYLKKLKKEEGALKLVGGRNDYEGNVEILHDGKWGSICDDEWDRNEAEVVCRQLGYPGTAKSTHSSQFGVARRRYWMDNIFCDGKEKELHECRFDGWGHSDCEPSEAAGVICESPPEPTEAPKIIVEKPKIRINDIVKEKIQIRLMGGRVKEEGRVEIKIGSSNWGTICGDGWSLLEGLVVCKMLGLGYANDALQTDFFGSGNSSAMVLSGTSCQGNESSIEHCLHDEIGDVTCPGPIRNVAAVTCSYYMPDLVFDHIELERTAHLEDKPMYFLQCAMEENCLATQAYKIQRENDAWHLETRRLLRFTARVLNAGNADFRPAIPKHLWEWHMCHMHYHSMEVFATFDIRDSSGAKVAEGHKASFCLEDNQCLPGIKPRYACANYGDQGISVNCSDIYRYNIDCQWVDISELDPGHYTMTVSINPEYKVPEMSFHNNAATCDLLYTETYARVFNCVIHRP